MSLSRKPRSNYQVLCLVLENPCMASDAVLLSSCRALGKCISYIVEDVWSRTDIMLSSIHPTSGSFVRERFLDVCKRTPGDTLYESLRTQRDVLTRYRCLDYLVRAEGFEPTTDLNVLCDIIGHERLAVLLCLGDSAEDTPLFSLPLSFKGRWLEFCVDNNPYPRAAVDPIISCCLTTIPNEIEDDLEEAREAYIALVFYKDLLCGDGRVLRSFFLRNPDAMDSFARFLGVFIHHASYACLDFTGVYNLRSYSSLFHELSTKWLSADFLRTYGATIFRSHASFTRRYWTHDVAASVLTKWYLPSDGHLSTISESLRLFLEHTLSPWRSVHVCCVVLDYLQRFPEGYISGLLDDLDTILSVFMGNSKSLAEWSVSDVCGLFFMLEENRNRNLGTIFPKFCLKCLQHAILLFEYLMVDGDGDDGDIEFMFDLTQSGCARWMLSRARSFMYLVGRDMFSQVPKDYARVSVKDETLHGLKLSAHNLVVLTVQNTSNSRR